MRFATHYTGSGISIESHLLWVSRPESPDSIPKQVSENGLLRRENASKNGDASNLVEFVNWWEGQTLWDWLLVAFDLTWMKLPSAGARFRSFLNWNCPSLSPRSSRSPGPACYHHDLQAARRGKVVVLTFSDMFQPHVPNLPMIENSPHHPFLIDLKISKVSCPSTPISVPRSFSIIVPPGCRNFAILAFLSLLRSSFIIPWLMPLTQKGRTLLFCQSCFLNLSTHHS